MTFDPTKHLIKVQGGRTYLPVADRIVWFREQHPDWGIVTDPLEINHDKQFAVFRATIFGADGKIMATGTKKEDVKGFGDYIEKAETGALGRALALCGFGTQFAPELDDNQQSEPPTATSVPEGRQKPTCRDCGGDVQFVRNTQNNTVSCLNPNGTPHRCTPRPRQSADQQRQSAARPAAAPAAR